MAAHTASILKGPGGQKGVSKVPLRYGLPKIDFSEHSRWVLSGVISGALLGGCPISDLKGRFVMVDIHRNMRKWFCLKELRCSSGMTFATLLLLQDHSRLHRQFPHPTRQESTGLSLPHLIRPLPINGSYPYHLLPLPLLVHFGI